MAFIHRHISILRLDLSICRLYSALVSIEELCAALSKLGISRHLACAVGTPQGLTGTISHSGEKPYKVFCRPKANCERDVLFAELFDGKKEARIPSWVY